jgi:hypothetical protein
MIEIKIYCVFCDFQWEPQDNPHFLVNSHYRWWTLYPWVWSGNAKVITTSMWGPSSSIISFSTESRLCHEPTPPCQTATQQYYALMPRLLRKSPEKSWNGDWLFAS